MFKTIIELHGFDASEWGIQRTHTYSVCIFLERDININIDIYIYIWQSLVCLVLVNQGGAATAHKFLKYKFPHSIIYYGIIYMRSVSIVSGM
jgi:hypothetical protein